jgi:hypothetical protein
VQDVDHRILPALGYSLSGSAGGGRSERRSRVCNRFEPALLPSGNVCSAFVAANSPPPENAAIKGIADAARLP